MSLEQDAMQLRRLKLKLAVNRKLANRRKMWANDCRLQVRCNDRELFASVVEEMVAEGLVTKEIGRNGALSLVYAPAFGS
jgi:hypothetical protein